MSAEALDSQRTNLASSDESSCQKVKKASHKKDAEPEVVLDHDDQFGRKG
jgi:hypothetical protein